MCTEFHGNVGHSLHPTMVSPAPPRRRLPRTKISVAPPPLLLEITERFVRVGYAGQAQPKHLVPLAPRSFGLETTAAQYYHYYRPVLQNVLSFVSQGLKERKVLVITDFGLRILKTVEEALERILLHDINAAAVAFVASLEMAGFSLRLPDSLVVYFARSEAHCVAFSANQVLEYTYQCCRTTTRTHGTTTTKTLQAERNKVLDNICDPGIVMCILKCLEACPRSVRKAIIANIVVAGDVFDTRTSVLIARQVRAVLRGDELQSQPQEGPYEEFLTSTPVNLNELSQLSENVGLVKTVLRPDLLAWIGANVWAAYWHSVDSEAACFQWKSSKA